jgi:hypothetical protein
VNRQVTKQIIGAGIAGAVLLVSGPAAHAYHSTFQAQPDYPESSLAIKVLGKPRAGGIVTLQVTGSNKQPVTDWEYSTTTPYKLDVYVHDRSVFSTCPTNQIEENNRIVGLPDKVKWIAGAVEVGDEGPFTKTFKYRSGSARKLMFCAYTSYGSDDAAMSALKHDLPKKKRKPRRR